MKNYVFIFARKGSIRLKKKNIKILNGKPLIAYSIDIARKIKKISKIFVSTNDNDVKRIAIQKKCIVIDRPKNLCGKDSPEWKSWQHAIRFVYSKYNKNFKFISLPATSPLRSKNEVISSINALKKNIDIVLCVTKTNLDPNFNMVYKKNKKFYTFKNLKKKMLKRNRSYGVYSISTVSYVAKPSFILKNKSIFDGKIKFLEIPNIKSIDIDTKFDFEVTRIVQKYFR